MAVEIGTAALGAITVALRVTLPLNLRPYRDAFVFAALIAILILRPQGLLVARSQYKRV